MAIKAVDWTWCPVLPSWSKHVDEKTRAPQSRLPSILGPQGTVLISQQSLSTVLCVAPDSRLGLHRCSSSGRQQLPSGGGVATVWPPIVTTSASAGKAGFLSGQALAQLGGDAGLTQAEMGM